MNVPPYEVVEMPARPLNVAPAQEARAERSDADWERGLNLFILAAASFFRSAAAKSPRGRRRTNGSKSPSTRKPPAAARKRRASQTAKRGKPQ